MCDLNTDKSEVEKEQPGTAQTQTVFSASKLFISCIRWLLSWITNCPGFKNAFLHPGNWHANGFIPVCNYTLPRTNTTYILVPPKLNLLCERLVTVTTLVLLWWIRLLLLMPFQMAIQIGLTLESTQLNLQKEYFFVHPSTIHGNRYSSLCELRCRIIWSLRLNAFPQPGYGHGNGF